MSNNRGSWIAATAAAAQTQQQQDRIEVSRAGEVGPASLAMCQQPGVGSASLADDLLCCSSCDGSSDSKQQSTLRSATAMLGFRQQ
jgi:hypothetical protein